MKKMEQNNIDRNKEIKNEKMKQNNIDRNKKIKYEKNVFIVLVNLHAKKKKQS